MDTLISWSLAAVGYFAAVVLVLWFTQRVEEGFDEGRKVAVAARRRGRAR